MLGTTMTTASTRPTATEAFLTLLREATRDGSFVKLTLGLHAGADQTLKNVFVRPVTLRDGARLSFVYRHATRDITRNFSPREAVAQVGEMLGTAFLHAHLYTTAKSAQLKLRAGREPRLILGKPAHAAPPSTRHDREKQRSVSLTGARWLRALGVTTAEGRVMRGMESKLRQIEKFTELLQHLLAGANLSPVHQTDPESTPGSVDHLEGASSIPGQDSLVLADMGCGKGYLTFAAYECLRTAGVTGAQVQGIETRAELVELCNDIARENDFAGLRFRPGDIASAQLDRVDVLVALHACDTATDDAIARGIRAGARLILVSPCCHKEIRPQLVPPSALAGALRHGILLERHAEFVTDALRAALLEWAGYDTKVFEFIATEHTAKNLMIAATKRSAGLRPGASGTADPRRVGDRRSDGEAAAKVRELAACYGIGSQRLAANLNFPLVSIG
jgi:SAM-dependent methyltransferase